MHEGVGEFGDTFSHTYPRSTRDMANGKGPSLTQQISIDKTAVCMTTRHAICNQHQIHIIYLLSQPAPGHHGQRLRALRALRSRPMSVGGQLSHPNAQLHSDRGQSTLRILHFIMTIRSGILHTRDTFCLAIGHCRVMHLFAKIYIIISVSAQHTVDLNLSFIGRIGSWIDRYSCSMRIPLPMSVHVEL